jgi:uncharacterized protein (DUF1810 family)
MYDLDRFINAQKDYYDTAYKEIKSGKKRSHWIWFIFPQIRGLGFSYDANYYGIKSKLEGLAYYNNDYLRNNLINITNALLENNNDIIDIVGYPDNLKIKSSMTLFYSVTNNIIFKNVIDKFYNGEFDDLTIKILEVFSDKDIETIDDYNIIEELRYK